MARAARIGAAMRRATAAVVCALFLQLIAATAHAEPLGIPGQEPGEPPASRDIRPVPPPAEPPSEANAEGGNLEVPSAEQQDDVLDMRPPAVIGPAGQLPDEVQADAVRYAPDGTIELDGVTLTVASLIENGGPAVVTAGHGVLNTGTGRIELSDGLSIAVDNVPFGVPLHLDAQTAAWDGNSKQLSVTGLAIPVPLRALLGDSFPTAEIAARFASHIRLGTPDYVYVTAESLQVKQSGKDYDVVLGSITAYPSPEPSADLYVTAREATLTAEGRIEVDNAALWVEGLKLATWPHYSHDDGSGVSGLLSFDTPKVSIDAESVEAREDVQLNLHPLHVDTEVAYAEQYNVIAHSFAYVDVWKGGQVGVQHGDVTTTDYLRNSYLRSDDVVFTARQRNDWGPWRWSVDIEKGSVTERPIGAGSLGDLVSTERTMLVSDIELTHARLGGDWYVTTGATGTSIDYGGEEYSVVGWRGGLIYRAGGFNNFVLYRENAVDGQALLPFDAVRRKELDFQARASLIPRLSHILRGVYDFTLNDYDRLELGTVLERRGYELGFYWDFARDRAGLELGILTP